jgi:transcriptional regulator with XRE-family HTH domain
MAHVSRLADRLSKAMEGRTQQWLADQVGVNQAAVSYWMRGLREPGLDTLSRVATVLDVSPGWLAFGEAGHAPDPLVRMRVTTRHPDAYTLVDRRGHLWRIDPYAEEWVRDDRPLPPWARSDTPKG